MQNVGAVILAAGESSRFGAVKQLVQFGGTTLVRRIVDAAREATCSPIVAVTGSENEKVSAELRSTTALVVENSEWRRGIGSSIRAGVNAIIDGVANVDAIVLLVCDQPFVDAHVIRKLIALHYETRKPIVAARYANTLGVPALFGSFCFDELLALNEESGAKSIILRERSRVAEFAFPDGKIDIDTPNDYEKLASC